MTPAAKLAAFGAVLVALFLAGLGVGSAAGPIDVDGDDGDHTHVEVHP